MYDKDHPVYAQLQKIGKEITQKVKPKAVVVFSAHWQGKPNVIEINTSENTDLIYESVFPCHS
jgi:4,5-DOPA dioxygenase extradiol